MDSLGQFIQTAEEDDPETLFVVGASDADYADGVTRPQKPGEAIGWLRKTGARGHAAAPRSNGGTSEFLADSDMWAGFSKPRDHKRDRSLKRGRAGARRGWRLFKRTPHGLHRCGPPKQASDRSGHAARGADLCGWLCGAPPLRSGRGWVKMRAARSEASNS